MPPPSLTPAISVLVPAYRCAPYIGDALRSLQAQGLADWEAIVIDDGTPDDLSTALLPFADDARIRVLHPLHGGLPAARNLGLAAARAPLIALLDGDDACEPDYLAVMIAAISADAAIGFVTCDATVFGTARLEGTRFSDRHPQAPPATLDRVLRRQCNILTACVVRTAAVRDVGGWTGPLRSAEDFDLWLRLLERGWRCDVVPQPLHRYRRRPDSLSAARLVLLTAVGQVYDAAILRLEGRPEQATAQAMRAVVDADIAFDRGEAMVMAGDVRDGLRELARAVPRTTTPAWRIAMVGMRLFPVAAPRFMRWRMEAAARA